MDTQESRPTHSTLYHVLNEKQLNSIHKASLDVLEKTGYHVPVEEVKHLLLEAGASAEGNRVYIPRELVKMALTTNKPVQIYDRLGTPMTNFGLGEIVFGALCDTPHYLDPVTRSVRSFRKEDQGAIATLLDVLPNIDYVQSVGQSDDVPNDLQSQVAAIKCICNTTKPLLLYPYDRQGMLDILEAAYIVAGSKEAFDEKPFLMGSSVPAGPLYGTDYNLELLMTYAEIQVPLIYYSCPAIGGNSPTSLVGTITLANADWLAALVMHQLKRPGAPFFTAGFTVQLMDMKTTLWAYCAPESMLAYAAIADLAHWYGLPAWGLEAISDTPQLDMQAGIEMATSCIWARKHSFEVVHNAGLMGSGKLLSAESLVLVDEIIAYVKRATQPFPGDLDQVIESTEIIEALGPMGDYLNHEHTLTHFRDFWYPRMLPRLKFDPRSNDFGPILVDRLNERALELIKTHEPQPLPDNTLKEIDALEAAWYRRARS